MSNHSSQKPFTSARLRKEFRILFPMVIALTLVNAAEAFIMLRQTGNFGRYGILEGVLWTLWLISVILLSFVYSTYRRQLSADKEKNGGNNDTLNFLSEHDDLTGLYRRHAAIEHMSKIPVDTTYTVLMLDVDEFKEINDVYGHAFGDRVLIDMANKIQAYAQGKKYFLSRYGSDEFLIVVFGQHVGEHSTFLNNLRTLIHEPIEIGLANIVPTVSIGIAYSDGVSSPQEILKHVDIALNESKKHGRKSVTVFTSEMEEQMSKMYDIKNKVYDATTHDGLYMVYQPKVRASDEKLVGFEALVRMKDCSLSPAVFIPIAEENGWLRQIGRITTEKVISQLAKWRDEGHTLYPVSINYSTVQVRDADYLGFLLKKLNDYQIPARYIEIEITESIFLEHMDLDVSLISEFRGAGIRVLLDDFGTGYSSLSYLSSMPLDAIKVDKSFVDEYLRDSRKMMLIRDIIQLGHDMGDEIIVEGVESREQFVHLRDMGADTIQGFVFSKPLPPDEAILFTPDRSIGN